MDRKLTDPNNYIPNGWYKLPSGKLARKSDGGQENPMVTNYKGLLNKSKTQFKDIKIRQSKPEPLEKDYKIGSIKRYFIQKSNDRNSPVYEVDRRESAKYSRSTRYTLAVIDWVISGGNSIKINSDITKTLTPEQMNQLSIANVSNIMPNLKLYLPNLLQYYKR